MAYESDPYQRENTIQQNDGKPASAESVGELQEAITSLEGQIEARLDDQGRYFHHDTSDGHDITTYAFRDEADDCLVSFTARGVGSDVWKTTALYNKGEDSWEIHTYDSTHSEERGPRSFYDFIRVEAVNEAPRFTRTGIAVGMEPLDLSMTQTQYAHLTAGCLSILRRVLVNSSSS